MLPEAPLEQRYPLAGVLHDLAGVLHDLEDVLLGLCGALRLTPDDPYFGVLLECVREDGLSVEGLECLNTLSRSGVYSPAHQTKGLSSVEDFQFQCRRTGTVKAYKRMTRQKAQRRNLDLFRVESSCRWTPAPRAAPPRSRPGGATARAENAPRVHLVSVHQEGAAEVTRQE